MTRRNVIPTSTHTDVEKALAFGRSDKWIIERYAVTLSEVDAVRAYIERVNEIEDGVMPVGRPECGTVAGFWAHRRYREPACGPCKKAEAAYTRSKRVQKVHGTYGGYRQHQRRSTTPCPACKEAYMERRRQERLRDAG